MSQSTHLESLRVTAAHISNIEKKISSLRKAREDAFRQLVQAAGRERLNFDDAASLYTMLKEYGIPASEALKAAGWTWQMIKQGSSPITGSGVHAVYALIVDGKVVYVGRSSNVRVRLRHHRRNGIAYDRVEVYRCSSKAAAADLEAVLQQQHRPVMNRRIEKRTAA